jgi:hypothetical protein
MATSTERLATLEQRLTDHESRCEERLGEIKATSAATLKAVEGLKGRAWGVVAALMTWALAQLWSENARRLEELDRTLPVAAGSGLQRLAMTSQPQPARDAATTEIPE